MNPGWYALVSESHPDPGQVKERMGSPLKRVVASQMRKMDDALSIGGSELEQWSYSVVTN
jgi:hypothetical protein